MYYCQETLASWACFPLPGISKSCLVNTSFLQSVRPLYNHRLEATLQNGEKLVITRNYIEPLKEKLKEQMYEKFSDRTVPSTCICFTLLLLANAA